LLCAALLAYIGAAKIALSGSPAAEGVEDRVSSVKWWLGALAVLSLVPLVGLAVTWIRGRVGMRALWLPARVDGSRFVAAAPDRVFEVLRRHRESGPGPSDYDFVDEEGGRQLHFVRSQWHGDWVLTLTIQPDNGDSVVTGVAEHVSRLPGIPVAQFVRRRAAGDLEKLLDGLQTWALPRS
jgi:hypothetical protein